jgi:hypothetical protein
VNKPKITVRLYRTRNRLLEKAGGGMGATAASMEFPSHILEETEHLFEEMISDYPDWVQGPLNTLTELVNTCAEFPEKRIVNFTKINEIAHEMKGQGGTFGYPLVSTFGDSLYDFTGPNAGLTDNHVEIVKAHVDAMRATIHGRIQGDGGQVGNELKTMLHMAIQRYAK